jgi:hypothetical protein
MYYFKLFLGLLILPIFTLQTPMARADDLLGPRFNLSDRPILFAQNLQTVQQTESGLENYLAQASKAPEKRVGLSIKNIQLGMNEYNFLTAIAKNFPLVIKNNDLVIYLMKENKHRLIAENVNIYLLFNNDQEQDYQAVTLGAAMAVEIGLRKSLFTIASFKDGILVGMLFSGNTLEKTFNVGSSPSKVFLDAFANNDSALNFSVESSTERKTIYSYNSADSKWSVTAQVDKSDDYVEYISLNYDKVE